MADDLKGLLASPEFTGASQPDRIKILSQHSEKFAGLDPASQIKSLSTLENKYGPSAPQRQAAAAEGNQAVKSMLSMGASVGLPIAGMGLGQALARGASPLMQAGARTVGSMAGGAAAGKLTGESGIPITGNPTIDQSLMAGVGQALPEVGAGLLGWGQKTIQGARGAKALTKFEDKAAQTMASVQDAVPWWKGQFGKDHAGIVDMAYVKGPELLSQGYGDAMAKIGPYVEGTPMLIPVTAAQRMKLNVKALERQPGASLGMPDEVVVDMGQVVKNLSNIRERDPATYRELVQHVDRYLGDVTGLPSEFKAARKAYSEGRGFIDAIHESGAIDPVTRRFNADKFGEALIKKDVLNQQASGARAPATRKAIQQVSPYDKPVPQRGEMDIKVPFMSRRVGSEMRAGEHLGPIRIPTARNVPGQTTGVSPVISKGLPMFGGGLDQIAREALARRNRGEE